MAWYFCVNGGLRLGSAIICSSWAQFDTAYQSVSTAMIGKCTVALLDATVFHRSQIGYCLIRVNNVSIKHYFLTLFLPLSLFNSNLFKLFLYFITAITLCVNSTASHDTHVSVISKKSMPPLSRFIFICVNPLNNPAKYIKYTEIIYWSILPWCLVFIHAFFT